MLARQWTILSLVGVLLLAGCVLGSAPASEAPMEAETAEDVDTAFFAGGEAAQVDVQEQLIIRTGEVAIVVEDTEATVDEITALAEGQGGWVVSSNVRRRSDNAFSGTITVRVPVDRFGETMSAVQELALEVERTAQESQDVTEEYVDLQARLQNLEATAARVRGFLDEADDVEDALAVNQELSRLESEIEALKGRIQYLEQSAAFSTITVSLTPDELSQPIEVGGWRPAGVAREAIETLINGLQVLATIIIWAVIVFLPLAAIVILPLALIILWLRRRRARSAAGVAGE